MLISEFEGLRVLEGGVPGKVAGHKPNKSSHTRVSVIIFYPVLVTVMFYSFWTESSD